MTWKSLDGKSILITGAAGGLGAEYARQLLGLGAHLVLADLVQESLDQVAGQLPPGPGKVLATVAVDISTPDGCSVLHERTREAVPHLDVLINNAGTIHYGYFWEIPDDHWERLMAVNLLASMRLCRLFLPEMVERGSGHLVFMCSVAGFAATALASPYVASKFGLRGFAMALSGETRDKGVDVTLVYPSWVRTRLLASPEFGSAKVGRLASFLADDPVKVVRESIRGIRKGSLHVCPGRFARTVWVGARLWPIVSRQAH